jgi:Protein of unknown function (DUF2852)
MPIVAACILLMVLGFTWWWPVGLVILAWVIGRGRMSGGYNNDRWERKLERLQGRMARLGGDADNRREWRSYRHSNGNRAFGEYRIETLRRLEDEQREFRGFLERLRQAKDKAEFDRFMAESRNHGFEVPARQT